VIRLKRANKCSNRRFYRIVLINTHLENTDPHREDIGSFDPMPNVDNQVVVGINFQRVKELMADRVPMKKNAAQLLGS
jgi:small subunit ribosomal protein S16